MVERRPNEALTGKQRRHLRGLGHGLDPVVQVGHQGVTDAVAKAVDEALAHHELIKVRLGKNAPDRDKDTVGEDLESKLGCHVVQAIGRVMLIFREAEEPEDRKIKLPRAPVDSDAADEADAEDED